MMVRVRGMEGYVGPAGWWENKFMCRHRKIKFTMVALKHIIKNTCQVIISIHHMEKLTKGKEHEEATHKKKLKLSRTYCFLQKEKYKNRSRRLMKIRTYNRK